MLSMRLLHHVVLAATCFLLVVGKVPAKEGRTDIAALETEIRKRADAVEDKLIAWRRDIHQHPELGDQETRTAGLVAEHLRDLGLEVHTKVARTGVVGILKGAKPGRTVALRADMDALPIKEPEGLPFASHAKAQYLGKEVDVMHAWRASHCLPNRFSDDGYVVTQPRYHYERDPPNRGESAEREPRHEAMDTMLDTKHCVNENARCKML